MTTRSITSLLYPTNSGGGGGTMALDLPGITALRRDAQVPAISDYDPPGIITNRDQDEVVDAYLSYLFFDNWFLIDEYMQTMPQRIKQFITNNVPPYKQQEGVRKQLVEWLKAIDAQDGTNEFVDFTTPFTKYSFNNAKSLFIGNIDDPGWSITDIMDGVTSTPQTIEKVRKHGKFQAAQQASMALQAFNSEYRLPYFASLISVVENQRLMSFNKFNENMIQDALRELKETGAKVYEKETNAANRNRKLQKINTLTNKVLNTAPAIPDAVVNVEAQPQPEPQLQQPVAQVVPVEQAEAAVIAAVQEVNLQANAAIVEMQANANADHEAKMEDLRQRAEAEHNQKVAELKAVAESNYAAQMAAAEAEIKAAEAKAEEAMRLANELAAQLQAKKSAYAQVPQPAMSIDAPLTAPTLIDIPAQSVTAPTLIDMQPPAPAVVTPTFNTINLGLTEPKPATGPPPASATTLVAPVTEYELMEMKQPAQLPKVQVEQYVKPAPAAISPQIQPTSTMTPTYDTVAKPAIVYDKLAAEQPYIPSERLLTALREARTTVVKHKTELEKAKAIAAKWWKAHPRAEAQDKGLKNQKVVTKAADYVPGKTDFRGVDLFSNSKSQNKK